ncbi:hypothetical protein [Janthinobacterium lividum]
MPNLSNKKSVLHLVTKNADCSSHPMHRKTLGKASRLGQQHRHHTPEAPAQARSWPSRAPRQKQAGKQAKEKWDMAAKECRDLNAVFDQNTGKEKSINCSQHQAIGRMKTHTTINHSTSST